jgi:hypothetical protein
MSYPVMPIAAEVGGDVELTVPPGYSYYTGPPFSDNPTPLDVASGYLVAGSLNPPYSPIGAPDFTLMVIGEGFKTGATIVWNGADEVTTFVSDKTVTTLVKPSTASVESVVKVHVRNPDGSRTRDLEFRFAGTVWVPPIPLTLASVAPATVPLVAGSGSAPHTFTLTGTGFKATSTITVAQPSAPTTWFPAGTVFVNGTTLTCSIAINDATGAGAWKFRVTEGSETTAAVTSTVTVA